MEKICVAIRLRPPVFEDSSNGDSKRSKRIVFCFTGFMTHHSLTLFMLLIMCSMKLAPIGSTSCSPRI
ncbi:hypothetical protein S83_065568 [Arachis hypogaea]